jgi:hypothetical protein
VTSPTHSRLRSRLVPSMIAIACLGGVAYAAAPAAAQLPQGTQSASPLFPTFAQGKVVNAGTGAGVSGILVTLRDPVTLDMIARDTTNANGVYRMEGLDSDEYAIKFNGSAKSYETGFLACNHSVVPTYGQACTFAPGHEGQARLQHL